MCGAPQFKLAPIILPLLLWAAALIPAVARGNRHWLNTRGDDRHKITFTALALGEVIK